MPARKPPSKQTRHGEAKPTPVRVQSLVLERPEPPSDLLDSTLEAWDAFWTSPLADYVQVTDLLSLKRLFVDYDELERTRAALYKDPGPKPDEREYESHNDFQHAMGEYNAAKAAAGRLIRDPRGGLKLNPLLLHLRTLEKNIISQEDRFGFSLRARQELGLNEIRARTLAEQNAAQIGTHGDQDEDSTQDDDEPRATLRLAPTD